MTETQVGSLTSAEVAWETASCRVGSNASPASPNPVNPNLARVEAQLVGHRRRRSDQVVVLPGPVEVVQDRQQGTDHQSAGLLDHRAAVALDALAVVRVLGREPLQIAQAFVQLGPGGLELGLERAVPAVSVITSPETASPPSSPAAVSPAAGGPGWPMDGSASPGWPVSRAPNRRSPPASAARSRRPCACL